MNSMVSKTQMMEITEDLRNCVRRDELHILIDDITNIKKDS